MTTLGGQRHIEIEDNMKFLQFDVIDSDLSGWAGDLQSFIFDLKKATYGQGLDADQLNDTAYEILIEKSEYKNTKFSNSDLLSDVDAKNIHEKYSESCNLSVALRNYYIRHTDDRFTEFVRACSASFSARLFGKFCRCLR